jgi:hypothetical protein
VTPSEVSALRRAWFQATEGYLFVVFDRETSRPVIEYPNPATVGKDWKDMSELPSALFRLFHDQDDAFRYRSMVIDLVSAGDVSMSVTVARFSVTPLDLAQIWATMFEVQMELNERQAEIVLEVVMSEHLPCHEEPRTVDTIFLEANLFH